jgi:hypothetical protein
VVAVALEVWVLLVLLRVIVLLQVQQVLAVEMVVLDCNLVLLEQLLIMLAVAVAVLMSIMPTWVFYQLVVLEVAVLVQQPQVVLLRQA